MIRKLWERTPQSESRGTDAAPHSRLAPETRNRAAVPRPGRASWELSCPPQLPRIVRKQSEQNTGLPLVGLNGTLASRPQLLQVAANISRGALLRLP